MNRSFPKLAWGGMLLGLALAATSPAAEPAQVDPLKAASDLLQQGKHAEAEEAFRALAAEHGVAASSPVFYL
jgi:hypothetical protein